MLREKFVAWGLRSHNPPFIDGTIRNERDPSDRNSRAWFRLLIATHYDKTARNFLAAIHLATMAIWLI